MALTSRNFRHAVLLLLPNLFRPDKLYQNLRHPVHEWLHTRPRQYPVKSTLDLHVVEHEFRGRLVTVDLVEARADTGTLSEHLGRIWKKDFYYGHCHYFPQPFRLIKRHYIQDGHGRLESILGEYFRDNGPPM